MANDIVANKSSNLAVMKNLINSDAMKKRMENVLGKESGTFLASVLDLYSSDTNLGRCDANKVMAECMKAAALKLPVTKSLGFCYVIPYGSTPQFQLGYKGYIQLAQRSGQYRFINADMIYEGEKVAYDRITGMLKVSGEATSEKVIGYFAYFQLLNGFEKCVYWTREKVEAHAKRYSKAWKKADSPWHTEFDAMALKTVIKNIISKYGVMSVEFANAVESDFEDNVESEINQNANGAPVDMPVEEEKPAKTSDEPAPIETDFLDAEPPF